MIARRLAAVAPLPAPGRARAAPQRDPGLPVRAGRDRLRRGRGPGPDRAAGPGGPGPQAGRRPARPEPGRGRRYPRRLSAAVPPGRRPLPDPLAGAGGHRQGRVRPRPGPGCPGCARGATGPGPVGPCSSAVYPGSKAGNAWARYGHGRPHDPAHAIPAAARYLVDHGARHNLDRALYAYNHSWAYVAKVKQLARRYAPAGVGGGERPDRPAPGPGPGLDQAAGGGLLRGLRRRAGPPPRPRSGPAGRPPPPLPGLRHPQRPAAARHHQPGRRPRPGQGRPTPVGRRRWPPVRHPTRRRAGRR